MANNGKGIGPRGLGAPKSMAKYGSMAKQTEPKDGKPVMVHNRFKGDQSFTSPNTGLTVKLDSYTRTSDSIPRNNVRNIFKATNDSKGFRDYVRTEYPESVDPRHKPKSKAKTPAPTKQTEPKTGEKKQAKENKAKKAVKKVAKAVSDDLIRGGAESKRQTRLARGAQKGTFFGLEKLFD